MPYRQPALPEPKPAPPPELIVSLAGADRRSSAVVTFQLFVLPLIAAMVLSAIATPTVGFVGLLVSAAYATWRWRRSRARSDSIVLSVASRKLTAQASHLFLHMKLADLENVELDTRTIRPVQEGRTAVPNVRFIESQVGPEVDIARIVIVGEGRRVALHDDYIAHIHATEWLGKIRAFLRKHDWLPLDEREAEA